MNCKQCGGSGRITLKSGDSRVTIGDHVYQGEDMKVECQCARCMGTGIEPERACDTFDVRGEGGMISRYPTGYQTDPNMPADSIREFPVHRIRE